VWSSKLDYLDLRVWGWAGLLAFVGAFGWGMTKSEFFAIERLEIYGLQRIAGAEVTDRLEKELGLVEGASMLEAAPAAIGSVLEVDPRIEAVTVSRVWPRRLRIEVKERPAAGIAVTPTGTWLHDESGTILHAPLASELRAHSGPVLSGFSGESLEPGRRLPVEQFLPAYRTLLTVRRASPSLWNEISEIRWTAGQGITFVLLDGSEFLAGLQPPGVWGPVLEELLEMRDAGREFHHASLCGEGALAVAWKVAAITNKKKQMIAGTTNR
jgi:hypothetical protein